MAEFSENEVKSQEVPLTGTDARGALAYIIISYMDVYDCAPHYPAPEDRSWASYGDQKQDLALRCSEAFLEALEHMELPEEVSRVGRETLLTHGRTLDDAFRAICAALRSPKTASEASR